MNELLKALSDKSKREQIKKTTLEGRPNDPSPIAIWGWHNYTILTSIKHPPLDEKNMIDLIEEQKRDGFEILIENYL